MKKALLGLLFGLLICLTLTWLAGENPLHVANVIFKSCFGSKDDLAMTLFYATSLIFTGLSVSVAFHAGLFNIGAEGQLTIGTMVTTGSALFFASYFATDSLFLGFLLSAVSLLIGLAAAGFWGFIPGYFKVKRDSHEVILTMMMNFIAAGFAATFVTKNQNPLSQNPESAEVPAVMGWAKWDPLHQMAPETPLNISLLIAVSAAILLGFLLYKSRWGFELRVTGQNEEAANLNGISAGQVKIKAMILAGVLAGAVAANEIFGSQMKYRLGFSPDYGFIGIAVALLARNHPWGILLSGFLFAALQKGAGDLDLETEFITRDFARIMQAILILSVSSFSLWKGKSK